MEKWEGEYRESIIKERQIQTQSIFRTVFPPNPPNSILLASSHGSLSSYSLSSIQPPVTHHNPSTAQNYIQAHDGPAYDIKFYGGDYEHSLLFSCGDDGRIRGWRWKEIIESDVPIHLQGTHLKPVQEFTNPQNQGPWHSLSPIPENNALAVDIQRGSIFAASGDCHAYCWDVEEGKIKMVFKGHSDYLHCIVSRTSSNQIISGSEDGTVRIWDCVSGKCIQMIGSKDKKSKDAFPYVSCIALDASESWMACGGGPNLSIFNLPACECVSRISTRASVQDISFDGNEVLAVGTQPLISRFDISGVIVSEIQSAPHSAFSVSLHPSGIMAVAGYGGIVDVISQFGSHLCTFRSKCI